MTDKARELLDEALSYTSCESWSPSLTEEIRAYLAEPEVKPLSDEDIIAKNSNRYPAYTSFYDGVRFAEKHYGIGGGE